MGAKWKESSMSFQDAKDLIDRDEEERLQFMNSNVSFSSAGISQIEMPSLMSVTSYFQQGSSFPVPHGGNDSTMFPGGNSMMKSQIDFSLISSTPKLSIGGTSGRDSNSKKPKLRRSVSARTSTSRSSTSTSSAMSSKGADASAVDDSFLRLSETNKGQAGAGVNVKRKDSLAKFFLGPESNGMKKDDIIEYVLDYCKRRSSFSLSNASDSDIAEPQPQQQRRCSAISENSEKRDSGISIVREEKTVISKNKKEVAFATEPTANKVNGKVDAPRPKEEERKFNLKSSDSRLKQIDKDKTEEVSVVLAAGEWAKDGVLDDVDVGGIDGFEKFKRNLLNRRRNKNDERYKKKAQHHAEFEAKRLVVDEKHSHPNLSPTSWMNDENDQYHQLWKQELCSKVAKLENDEKSSDVKLVSVDGHNVFAHRWILSEFSDVFEAMFRTDMVEKETGVGVVKLEDLSGKTLRLMVHFIYAGVIGKDWSSPDIIEELIYCSNKYQIGLLRKFLDANLGKICTIENAGNLLALAVMTSMEKAASDIFEFIKRNVTDSLKYLELVKNTTAFNESVSELLSKFQKR